MERKSVYASLILHVLIAVGLTVDFSFSYRRRKVDPVPLMIDLNKVEIADKTNLPAEMAKKKQPEVKKTPPKAEPEKKKTSAVKQVSQKAPEPKKEVKPIAQKPDPKAVKAVEKKQPKNVNQKKQKQTTDKELKSLLASVEKIKKTPVPHTVPPEETQTVNQGIEGGFAGSFNQVLSVSEIDFISSQLRKCWNVNAGAEGVENLVIEIKTWVNKDGRVRDVKVMNSQSNPFFQAMADSAVRAVYVCDNLGEDSPFRILATRYPEHYQDWKEMSLRFNPLEEGVF